MNIFILDKNPIIAAKYLHDIHVRKMLIEGVQLLTNGYTINQLQNAPKTQTGNVRKYSHYNHPSSIWVRKTYDNWKWLYEHVNGIYSEFLIRSNKDHFCHSCLIWFGNNAPSVPYGNLTPFALAMPEEYKSADAIESYRNYYINNKQTDKNGNWMMKYTKRNYPDWFPNWLIEKCKENNV